MRIEWRNVLPNRHSKSRIARVGKWTLIVVVAAFAVIGFLHLTRGTAVRHVRGVGEGRLAAGVSEPEVPLSVTMLTGAWLASGHRVEVALNGDGTYAHLWDDLRSAQPIDHAAAVLTDRPVAWRIPYGRSRSIAPRRQSKAP